MPAHLPRRLAALGWLLFPAVLAGQERLDGAPLSHSALVRTWPEPAAGFGHVFSAIFVGDDLVVLQNQEPFLVRFDHARATMQVGREGSGPLEFRNPMQLMALGDSLNVFDVGPTGAWMPGRKHFQPMHYARSECCAGSTTSKCAIIPPA